MTTRQAGPSRDIADSTPGRRRELPYWGHVLQMIGVEVLAVLATGAVFLAPVRWRLNNPDGDPTEADSVKNAVLAMAVAAVVAIVGWIGWTLTHRRPRVVEVATALFLMIASLIGLLLFYANYKYFSGNFAR